MTSSITKDESTERRQDVNDVTSSKRAVAISIGHISKTYPVLFTRLKKFFHRPVKPAVEALRDVSFDVYEGEIFGLIGPNGAGKTTLAKIVATLVQPTSGIVTVKDFDSVSDDRKVRAEVGLATAEERSFYWRLTAEQNLMFFARLVGMSDDEARKRIIELLEQLDLIDLATRRFGEMSTGNKQRLALARALLARPPVLLLDEPTRSLDPLAASRMRDLIRSLACGDSPVSILLTSHNLPEVEELCERIAVINHGRIRALGRPVSLRAQHKETEKVRITASGLTSKRAYEALGTLLTDLVVEETSRATVVTFTRESLDDSLDKTVRGLQLAGGTIVDVDIERATLLDVLESYQGESETAT